MDMVDFVATKTFRLILPLCLAASNTLGDIATLGIAQADAAEQVSEHDSPLFEDETRRKPPIPPPTPAQNHSNASESAPSDQLFDDTAPAHSTSPADLLSRPSAEQSVPSPPTVGSSVDWLSGRVALELRGFPEFGVQQTQDYNHNFSLAFEPQLKTGWNLGATQLSVVPFLRLDEHDNRRTHSDIREFLVSQSLSAFTTRLGIGRVFWGVTESRHTVDIINQSDLVENPDGEDKLGQPMLNMEYASRYGNLQFFFLPFSRPRTYPGVSGRLRPPLPISQSSPIYRGGAGRDHRDFAGRWSYSVGPLDVGVSHFYGTTREPIWRFRTNQLGQLFGLVPVYDVIQQTSLDLAWAVGSWLWKLETFTRSGQGARFEQVTGGFEYTFSGAFNTGADLGLLFEYLYDGRPKENLSTPFDRDIFVGTRLAANDAQSTEVLAGVYVDAVNASVVYSVEASRRLGETWKLNFEARGFGNTAPNDFTRLFKRENYLMIEIEKYF